MAGIDRRPCATSDLWREVAEQLRAAADLQPDPKNLGKGCHIKYKPSLKLSIPRGDLEIMATNVAVVVAASVEHTHLLSSVRSPKRRSTW